MILFDQYRVLPHKHEFVDFEFSGIFSPFISQPLSPFYSPFFPFFQYRLFPFIYSIGAPNLAQSSLRSGVLNKKVL